MSERPSDEVTAHPHHLSGSDAGETTGHRDVDDVLASLEELATRPVSEHVPVFESAHDRLRAALADVGDHSSGT